ncbi:hypothetical protein BGX38DRAFT_1273698 [Terfezia claveryi]|nr:hypothetical protein BGX38DRAFT_1273698 [Terfezia claveryi]
MTYSIFAYNPVTIDHALFQFQVLHDLLWPSSGPEYTTSVIINNWVLPAAAPPGAGSKSTNTTTNTEPSVQLLYQPDDEVEAPSNHMVLNLAFRSAERVSKRQVPPLTKSESGVVRSIQSLLPCKTSRLLIRPAYVTLLQLMEERDRLRCEQHTILDPMEANDAQALGEAELELQLHVIVTGQPGIGKSFLLSYILIHRQLNGLPTIFQAEGGVNYYFFNHDGVSLIPVGTVGTAHTATRDHRVWALIDTKPDPSLWSATCWLIIQASSPQVERENL